MISYHLHSNDDTEKSENKECCCGMHKLTETFELLFNGVIVT